MARPGYSTQPASTRSSLKRSPRPRWRRSIHVGSAWAGVVACLSVAGAVGCSEPDRVTPVSNTGAYDGTSVSLDAINGLDAIDGGGGQVTGCASDPDCIPILGALPACQVGRCHKAVCEIVNAADAASCDDGDPCTESTTCLGGSCLKGVATPCDDDNPCTDDSCASPGGCTFTSNHAACGAAACAVGVCTKGACAVVSSYGATMWPNRRVRALVADGDGWIAAMQVAVTGTDAAAPSPTHRWLRLDPSGAAFADLPLAMTVINAGTRMGQGDVVFAGLDQVTADGAGGISGGGSRDGAMIRVAMDGTPRWRRTYHRGADDRLNAVVALTDDSVAACGRTAKAGVAGEAWYIRGSSSTGFPLFDYVYGSADDETCNGLISLGNDQLLMVGAQTGASGNGQALAFRISVNAKLIWNRTWGGKGHDEAFAAAARADGALWIAGRCAAGGVSQACVWLLDAKGDLLLSRALLKPGLGGAPPPAAAELFAIAARPGGGVVVAGRMRSSLGTPWRGFAAWRDASLNPIATRVPVDGPGWLRALVVDAQGGVALAGAASTTDAPNPTGAPSAAPPLGGAAVLVRMTPWGVPCVATAPCALKSAGACDDGDPCTVDWCGVVCDHAPLPEGAPCGAGKTCQTTGCAMTP